MVQRTTEQDALQNSHPGHMDAALKAKWVEALRSAEYDQVKEVLHEDDGGYCCLGVLCCVMGAEWGHDNWPRLGSRSLRDIDGDQSLSEFARTESGLPLPIQGQLIDMNDSEGKSFSEIADFIEKNL